MSTHRHQLNILTLASGPQKIVSDKTSTFRRIRDNKMKKIALATAFAIAAASASGWVLPALLLIAIAAAANKN